MPFQSPITIPSDIPAVLIADLQLSCKDELGRALSASEAEDLGRRMLSTFALLFEVRERNAVHRSKPDVPLTNARTNGTLSMP